MAGKFIVIEGTDGSGKTTQFKLLVEKLKSDGFEVETVDFPQYGKPSAGMVEQYLNGRYGSPEEVGPYRASIFYACDRYDASFKMKDWLKQGRIIIANRYETSNRAYQGQNISDAKERKKFFDWLQDLEYNIFKIPKPDLIILLYVPAEIGQQLVAKKEKRSYTDKVHDIYEADLELLKRTEQVYLELASDSKWKKINCVKDGKLMPVEEIHAMVYSAVKAFLQNK